MAPHLAERLLPATAWLRQYRRDDLPGDLVAGLTTAVMLVPQAMAYALLAGLPPVVGLYASLLPLCAYALFGTTRQLAVGPVALDSMLVAVGLGALAEPGTADYVSLAVMLALMVGVVQVVMGVARLGFLNNFLAQPVVSGFTSAAALIIAVSQLGKLLGVALPSGTRAPAYAILAAGVQRLGQTHLPTLAIGAGVIALVVGLQRWAPRVPGTLLAVAAATLMTWALGWHEAGVAVTGAVAAGLPPLGWPALDRARLVGLWPTALTLALIGFFETISIGRALGRQGEHEPAPNRELFALGLANVAAALSAGYPVGASFGRSAVNARAGARTPLASLFTAGTVALSLVLLAPALFYVPETALAAIIIVSVIGLIDVREVRRLYGVKLGDLALLLVTFVATLAIGVQQGLLIGIGAALLWFIVRTTRPHTAVLGRLPGTEVYRNVLRHPEAETTPGVLVVRMDAQLYFGNVSFLKQRLDRFERELGQQPLRALVIDASGINQLDSSAASALEEIAVDHRERGVRLLLANVKGPVRDVLRRSGMLAGLGSDAEFLTVHEAVNAVGAR